MIVKLADTKTIKVNQIEEARRYAGVATSSDNVLIASIFSDLVGTETIDTLEAKLKNNTGTLTVTREDTGAVLFTSTSYPELISISMRIDIDGPKYEIRLGKAGQV